MGRLLRNLLIEDWLYYIRRLSKTVIKGNSLSQYCFHSDNNQVSIPDFECLKKSNLEFLCQQHHIDNLLVGFSLCMFFNVLTISTNNGRIIRFTRPKFQLVSHSAVSFSAFFVRIPKSNRLVRFSSLRAQYALM
ncbi:hypothetical protein BpHYR1_016953 [Brachionus plicatilis]|uniref:Uncharacterized protein n=1 Tax=Brachionus plicatilis TaxID=10195 RepID=A0A3M7SS60_BRAPC|nr:hypothetical protein BpHYR1_016953 [Brachionus plicatilis]